MELQKIVKLMEKKYPYPFGLILFDDGSGRITEHMERPYDAYNIPVFEFSKIEDLILHLQEN